MSRIDSDGIVRGPEEVDKTPPSAETGQPQPEGERPVLPPVADEPEPRSEPPTPEGIDALIEAEVGEFIAKFRAEHPAMYRVLKSRLEHPLKIEMNTLVRDAVYRQLKADTDEAVDLGQIVKAIAGIVLDLAGRFLPLIG